MSCRLLLRRPRALAVSLFALIITSGAPSIAQQIPQVVVTATRSEQAITDTLASTTVLTREDIRDTQSVDLPSLLRGAAGIEITQNGGFGNNASVFMRGGNSNHTLILLDGMRINSSTLGTTAL